MRWPLEDKKEAIESTSERLRRVESASLNLESLTRTEEAIGPWMCDSSSFNSTFERGF